MTIVCPSIILTVVEILGDASLDVLANTVAGVWLRQAKVYASLHAV